MDTDSYDFPLLRAILVAGSRPRIICARVNSDVPPPMAFLVEHSRHGSPFVEQGLTKPGHGFAGASADALFHLLSGDSRADGRDGLPPALYSLVAFELGRPPRYVVRAAQNMWFVRSDLLGLPSGRRLTSWHQMVAMFWGQWHAQHQNIRMQPGKYYFMSPWKLQWFLQIWNSSAANLGMAAWRGRLPA
eukprot:2852548-Prymnesium_polylepis.1